MYNLFQYNEIFYNVGFDPTLVLNDSVTLSESMLFVTGFILSDVQFFVESFDLSTTAMTLSDILQLQDWQSNRKTAPLVNIWTSER